jgi:hypothetical protein
MMIYELGVYEGLSTVHIFKAKEIKEIKKVL